MSDFYSAKQNYF